MLKDDLPLSADQERDWDGVKVALADGRKLSAPLLADRTGYVIPPGPYRDDARGTLPGPGSAGSSGPPAQQAPQMPS